MRTAIVFVNNTQVSIIGTKEELIKEINHYQAFWLTNIGTEYTNKDKNVRIAVQDLTESDRAWLRARMH